MTTDRIQAVVLAGGRATRLGDLARTTPKALQPVAGRPLLDRIIDPLLDQGFTRLHFCLGHLFDAVVRHLDETYPSLNATVSVEATPRGTAGALVDALPHLDDVFLVLLGDTYAPLDHAALLGHLPPDADALMALTTTIPDVAPNVVLRDGRVHTYDKSRTVPGGLIDTGIAVLRRRAVERFAARTGPLDLGTVFHHLLQQGRLAGRDVGVPCHDIGTPERLALLETRLTAPAPC